MFHEEPGNRNGVLNRRIVAAPVSFDGTVQMLAVSIHQTANGNYQYDFTFDRSAGAGAGDGKPGVKSGGPAPEGSLPSLEVPQSAADASQINLFVWRGGSKTEASAPFGWDFADAGEAPRLSDPDGDEVNRILRRVAGLDQARWSERIESSAAEQVPHSSAGFAAEMQEVHSFRNDVPLKTHPDYRGAKSGDPAAAIRLVADLFSDADIAAAASAFGPAVVYVPVTALEASGHNRIPTVLAEYYAARTGAGMETGIVQASKAYHTGASAMERIATRVSFAGAVTRGTRYVLVDDVTVMGSTLADLASHVRAGGGEVAGVVTLVNAARDGRLVARPNRVRSVERRFGDAIREEFGIDPSALTGPEVEYLLNFRDADAFRARAAAARKQRDERLGQKGLRAPATEGQEGVVTRGNDDEISYSLTENRIVEELSGKLTDIQPALLKAVPLNYFPELARPNMTAVTDYLKVKRLLDAYRGRKHAEADAIAQDWLKYMRLGFMRKNKAKTAALADLMHASTLSGFDPTLTDVETKAKPGYDELHRQYLAMPPAGRKLYANVRDAPNGP